MSNIGIMVLVLLAISGLVLLALAAASDPVGHLHDHLGTHAHRGTHAARSVADPAIATGRRSHTPWLHTESRRRTARCTRPAPDWGHLMTAEDPDPVAHELDR